MKAVLILDEEDYQRLMKMNALLMPYSVTIVEEEDINDLELTLQHYTYK
jgi:hypothetical protein